MLIAAVLAASALLVGSLVSTCGGPAGTQAGPAAASSTAPPVPPAACLLDTAAFEAATGIAWTPDATTATDGRCVFDPAGPQDDPAFVTATVAAPAPDAATALTTLAQLCDARSRAEVPGTGGGFVCRFQTGTVVGAAPRGAQLLTLTASAVPKGTTADRLTRGLAEQLAR